MGRTKIPTHKRSYNVRKDLYDWIVVEAERNSMDISAQVNMMLAKSKRLIEKEKSLEETYSEDALMAAEPVTRFNKKSGDTKAG